MVAVAILYGGRTVEHEVSCRSAASVVANLDRERYAPLLIGIDEEGAWHLQETERYSGSGETRFLAIEKRPESLVHVVPARGLAADGKALTVDIVFPVLHGSFGEDGTVQGLLELARLPYVGAGVLASALSMDKAAVKTVWRSAGLPIVPFMTLSTQSARSPERLAELAEEARGRFGLPLFVKPVSAGSSLGVARVERLEGFAAAVREALRFDTRAIVEPAIAGREIECSVTGNAGVEAYPPGEIVSRGPFYDYEAKYVDPDGARLIVPAELPAAKIEEIKRVAEAAYESAGVEGFARVDFFLEAGSGAVLLNEINTIPGFTNISMFARMCAASGLAYPQLLDKLIGLGLERHRLREAIEYSR